MMKKGIISVISMIIVLVFILVAFFSPWWSGEQKYSFDSFGFGETDYHQDMYLTKTVIDGTEMGQPIEQSINHDDLKNLPPMLGADTSFAEDLIAPFNNTQYLTIGLIITSILALIGILGFVLGKANMMRKIGIIFGIVTFILAIIVVFYFAISLNNVVAEQGFPVTIQGETQVYDTGFWFSINTNEIAISFGPGIAWYLMILAGITSLISSVAIYKTSSFVQIVPIEEKKQEKITKTIKCPSCGEIKEVQGAIGEQITIICPKCNTKGVFQFR